MKFPQQRPHWMRTTPLAVLVLFPALLVGIARAAEAPPLHDGLDLAIKTFGELHEKISSLLASPADRSEAASALRKLATRLDSLASAKQALTELAVNATWPRDRNKVANAAETLKAEVRRTRFALTDFFAPLPADWQTRSGDIQTLLELNLQDKWQGPNDIARDLRLDGASSEQLRSESEQLISRIHQLQELVGGLQNDLGKAGSQ